MSRSIIKSELCNLRSSFRLIVQKRRKVSRNGKKIIKSAMYNRIIILCVYVAVLERRALLEEVLFVERIVVEDHVYSCNSLKSDYKYYFNYKPYFIHI